MKIRWTFIYSDNHLAVDVTEELEDERISRDITDLEQLLYIPSQGKDAYVNLKLVKLVLREEVDENAKNTEIPAEPVEQLPA